MGNKRLGMELCHVLPASTLKLLFVSLQDPRVTLLSSFSQAYLALLAKYKPQGFPQRAYSGALSLSLLKTDVLIFFQDWRLVAEPQSVFLWSSFMLAFYSLLD